MYLDERDEGPTVDLNADDLLYVTSERLAAATVVAAAGEIDLLTAEDLAAAVRAGDTHRAVTHRTSDGFGSPSLAAIE